MTTAPSRPDTVPYIARWSGETGIAAKLAFSKVYGIAYADETSADRDSRGVLWARYRVDQGSGEAKLGTVHPQRQREVMEALSCQWCGGPADQDERGMLWLLGDNRADWTGWPNDLLTTDPPACVPCTRKVHDRPHFIGKYVAVRVGASDICAVYGAPYRLTGRGLMAGQPDVFSLTSSAARWVIAGQLVRALSSCTIVDVQAEIGRRP